MPFVVNSNFIGNFKDGDNIVYNLKVLGVLYKISSGLSVPEKIVLNKPIIILIVSVIEVILHDLFFRIKNEVVLNIPSKLVTEVRNKKFYKLEHYITQCEKFDLFRFRNTTFYEDFRKINRLRNRIHIQNVYKYKPFNESSTFTTLNKETCEQICEIVLYYVRNHYYRQFDFNYVNDFIFPWSPHYLNKY